MMGVELTNEERELLTEDELAAMEIDEDAMDGEDPEEEPEELPEVAEDKPKEDDPGEDPEDEPEEPTEKVEDKPEEKPAEEPEQATDDPGEDQEPEIPKVDFQPKLDSKVPDDVKQRISEEAGKINADLEKQAADLKAQYDNGDIDATEYIDKIDPIRQQMADNRAEVRDEMMSAYRDQQMVTQRWEAEQDAFFRIYPDYDAPRYENNKLVSGNPVMYGALDAACDKVNREQPGLSGIDLLMKAKAEVDKAMGITPKKTETPQVEQKPSAQRPGKTVGDIPAAQQEDAGAGEFAHLDKLDGDKLEEELAKLPADKRDRYLAGA